MILYRWLDHYIKYARCSEPVVNRQWKILKSLLKLSEYHRNIHGIFMYNCLILSQIQDDNSSLNKVEYALTKLKSASKLQFKLITRYLIVMYRLDIQV